MKYRIPRRVNLGYGFVLRVTLLPPLALMEELMKYADQEIDKSEGTVSGFLDGDSWTIYINSRLSAKNKWDTYWHELQHAITDIKDLVRGD